MADLSKEQEIKLLQELAEGNGYFAEVFGKDVHQMVSNIRNDFPIDMSTSISEKETLLGEADDRIEQLEKDLRKAEKVFESQKTQIGRLKDQLITVLDSGLTAKNNGEVFGIESYYSDSLVIRSKARLGIPFSKKEVALIEQVF